MSDFCLTLQTGSLQKSVDSFMPNELKTDIGTNLAPLGRHELKALNFKFKSVYNTVYNTVYCIDDDRPTVSLPFFLRPVCWSSMW